MTDKDKTMKTGEARPKIWIRSLRKVATIREVLHDPVWGPQYFVSTYSREWGPEFFWVKTNDVDEIRGKAGG